MRKFIAITSLCLFTALAFAQSYGTVESVEYDPENNRFLVSNNTSIISRASDGTLSFFGTARANYGMEVMNGVLYCIYNGNIRSYDLETEELIQSYNVPGDSFLNGMASDGENRVWMTDFGNGNIYEVDVTDPSNMTANVVATVSGSPNGICYDEENNRCVFGMWGANAAIRMMSLDDYSTSNIISTGLSSIDGLDRDGNGNYFISTWSPQRITKYDNSFANPETITVVGLNNPADIGYAVATDTLAIPNSGNGTVLFIGFNTINIEENDFQGLEMKIFPTPSNSNTEIQFYLENSSEISLDLYDINGKHVKNLMNGRQNIGVQRVIIPEGQLSAGIYLTSLTVGNINSTGRLVIQ